MTQETKQEQVTKPEDQELEELAELPEEETEVSISYPPCRASPASVPEKHIE